MVPQVVCEVTMELRTCKLRSGWKMNEELSEVHTSEDGEYTPQKAHRVIH
jgi:hypothetical protein